jgi:hypothetical protein
VGSSRAARPCHLPQDQVGEHLLKICREQSELWERRVQSWKRERQDRREWKARERRMSSRCSEGPPPRPPLVPSRPRWAWWWLRPSAALWSPASCLLSAPAAPEATTAAPTAGMTAAAPLLVTVEMRRWRRPGQHQSLSLDAAESVGGLLRVALAAGGF